MKDCFNYPFLMLSLCLLFVVVEMLCFIYVFLVGRKDISAEHILLHAQLLEISSSILAICFCSLAEGCYEERTLSDARQWCWRNFQSQIDMRGGCKQHCAADSFCWSQVGSRRLEFVFCLC